MIPRSRPPGLAKPLGVLLAVVGGAGVALQSRVNGALTGHLGSAYLTAVVHFGLGLAILTVTVALWPGGRAALRRATGRRTGPDGTRARPLPWWTYLGGLAGAFFVAVQAGTVPVLGVALFTVAVVAGQAISSLAVDRLGLSPGGVRLITLGRAIGPLLTVVAVAISVGGGLTSTGALLLAILPVLAGAGGSWQQAVNGRVRGAAVGAPGAGTGAGAGGGGAAILAATFVNFLVGTTALLVVLGVSVLADGVPDAHWPGEPWLYTGPLLGIFFVAVSAAVVHRIGVLLLGLSMIAGQVGGALVIDAVTGYPPTIPTLVGAALTLVAIVLPSLAGRRRTAPQMSHATSPSAPPSAASASNSSSTP